MCQECGCQSDLISITTQIWPDNHYEIGVQFMDNAGNFLPLKTQSINYVQYVCLLSALSETFEMNIEEVESRLLLGERFNASVPRSLINQF